MMRAASPCLSEASRVNERLAMAVMWCGPLRVRLCDLYPAAVVLLYSVKLHRTTRHPSAVDPSLTTS